MRKAVVLKGIDSFFWFFIAVVFTAICVCSKDAKAMDTTFVNGVRQIVTDCTLDVDTTPHVFAITHHKSDLESAEWLDTAGVWMWIENGIAIKHRGGWQRYLRPRFVVIDLGVLSN